MYFPPFFQLNNDFKWTAVYFIAISRLSHWSFFKYSILSCNGIEIICLNRRTPWVSSWILESYSYFFLGFSHLVSISISSEISLFQYHYWVWGTDQFNLVHEVAKFCNFSILVYLTEKALRRCYWYIECRETTFRHQGRFSLLITMKSNWFILSTVL